MRVLLDTNIIIHREASRVINQDIGQLFRWIDQLGYKKCVHPLTLQELEKHKDPFVVDTMKIKLASYQILKTEAPVSPEIQIFLDTTDKSVNDIIDSKILNELFNKRVDIIITEDKNIHVKASQLGISSSVYTIDRFIQQALIEHPELVDYEVLSVRKEYFGNINLKDSFFDTFREDYPGFDNWFSKKADEIAYICTYNNELSAFLYLKVEDEKENYSNISPGFLPKKRLKIGTLKVALNGVKIGERFLKIVFDNALRQKVEEIYVTIFDKRPGQKSLIQLLTTFGFVPHGVKNNPQGEEIVLVKKFDKVANKDNPKSTFPFIPKDTNVYLAAIYKEYHTELFPDSILKTESKMDFVENKPHRNAIQKVYISHAIERPLKTGDVLLIYRTGGLHKGVVTTVCIVDSVIDNIKSEEELISVCQKRTVLSTRELKDFWNRSSFNRPFVVNLLYSYSLPRRPNLKRLIELGIVEGVDKFPRGFGLITWSDFEKILKDTGSNESTIGN